MMKKYENFDSYLNDQPKRSASIIRALRRFVKRAAPGLVESVMWGNGCWVQEESSKEKPPKGKLSRAKAPRRRVPIAYVYSAPDHVQFGFIRGSALKDPRGLLEGNGEYVRHVKLRKASDLDKDAFEAFLRQATR